MTKNFLYSAIFLLISLQTAYSQQKNDPTTIQLTDVEINANSRKLYSEMGRILTIIDKTEISKSAATSVDQLLDYVAGIDIRQRGTNGTQADISFRGGSFDQVLVLLNGVNITDPQTGHFNLDIPLNLSDVSRVEILQGSSARVLGPNAFSGAINIVTESNGKRALNAELTGGSYNTFGQSVSGSLGNKKLQTFASVSHKKSDGYMNFTDFDMSSAFSQTAFKTDNAGRFDLQLAAQQKAFGANSFYSLKYPNQFERTKTFLASLNWSLTKGKISYSAQGYWRQHHDRFELYRDSISTKPSWYIKSGHNYHQTDITGGKASASYSSKIGKTTVGIDVRNEHILSNALGLGADSVKVPFETNKFFTKSYYRVISTGLIDHSASLGKWYFSLGLSTTYSEDFHYTTYGGLDVGYSVKENMKLFVSANSSTRIPTFTDLFLVSSVQQGNAELKPEQSKTIEIGTKINEKQWSLNAAIFYRMGQNVIDWIKPNSSSVKYEASNLAEVNALGGDISLEYRFQELFIKKVAISYSYLELDKTAEGFDSKYALDYLKNKVTLKLEHNIYNNLSASWNLGYLDRTGNYDANTVAGGPTLITNYNPYLMLDGRLLWSQKKFDIFADANNILNKKYADIGGIPQPGFNFNAGIRVKL